MKFFKWLTRNVGLDTATSSAVLARMWSLLSGPITLLLVIKHLSPEEQGYLGVFESIVAVRIFVELGLSTVLMQFVSHERGQLTIDREGNLEGPHEHRVKIASLLKNAALWYSVLSLVLFAVLWLGGNMFFNSTAGSATGIGWQLPILLISINTACSLVMQPFFGVLEGMGRISEFFVVGLATSILTSLSLWLSLSLGLGLISIPISAFFGLLPSGVSLFRWRRLFRTLLGTPVRKNEGINWKKEILPLQIRTAVTAILGYFIFNLTMPMVFAILGSVAAGQLGQTFRLTAMILGLSNAWILTRSATYGRLISTGLYSDLAVLFRKSIVLAVVVSILGCLALTLPLWAATKLHAESLPASLGFLGVILRTISEVSSRLGSLSVILALGANTILSAFIYGLQAFVRAHRKEPFIPNAVVAAITVPLITYIGARYGGLEILVWSYFARTLLIELPLTVWVFNRSSCIKLNRIFSPENFHNDNSIKASN